MIIFNTLTFINCWAYFKCVFTDPGFVPEDLKLEMPERTTEALKSHQDIV